MVRNVSNKKHFPQNFCDLSEITSHREAIHGVGSYWIDNFNLDWHRKSQPSFDGGTYTGANWTAWTFHPFVRKRGPHLSINCVRNVDGEITSAMPPTVDKLFSYKGKIVEMLKKDEDEIGNDAISVLVEKLHHLHCSGTANRTRHGGSRRNE